MKTASRPPRSSVAVTAVIAAAGSGERLGAGGPKAFVPVAGRPLIEWSLAALRSCGCVESIVVAAPPGFDGGLREDVRVVDGGATRAESVANALAVVATEVVAIHDAARPLVTAALVEELVAALAAHPEAAAVIPAAPITDTIKRTVAAAGAPAVAPETASERAAATDRTKTASTPEGVANAVLVVAATEDRSTLWAAQTPQVFRTAALRQALAVDTAVRAAATDEAMLIEATGGTVLIHPSSPENLKVTTPHDLRLAELLLAER